MDIALVLEVQGWAGFGKQGRPEFWFGEGGAKRQPMHIVFTAENRAQVRAFYEAALAPGIREIYHPNYYGAFVFDPDGYDIEAVCHAPEP